MSYECKFDADAWQLYSGMRGVEAVAADLSGTLTVLVQAAKARLREEPCLSEHKLASKIRDDMYKVMDRVSKFGACDTEPSCVLVAELERAFGLPQYGLDR
jgi:hypothetical protein